MAPPNLTLFEAANCPRLRRINKFEVANGFDNGFDFEIEGCRELVEVGGLFKVGPIDDEMVKKLETHGLPLQLDMAKVGLPMLTCTETEGAVERSFTVWYYSLVEVDGVYGAYKAEPTDDEMVKKLETHGLPHMAKVRLHMRNGFTNRKTTISYIPAVSEEGVYSIYIPGSVIPNWYSHQNEGNSVSFIVPHKSDITGFIFYAVYAWDGSWDMDYEINVFFKNESKHVRYEYFSSFFCYPDDEQDITWHGFWRFGDINGRNRFMHETQGGDQVKVEFTEGMGYPIKKCGVGLLCGQNNIEDSQINTSLFLQL